MKSKQHLKTKKKRSQHSQKCKDPCRQCFCDSWPWLFTFWPQNKRVFGTYRGIFLRQVWWS